MVKKIFSILLIFTLTLPMVLSSGVVFASDRAVYNIHDASEYIGKKDYNMNVYPEFMYAGTGTGATFTVFSSENRTYAVSVRLATSTESSIKLSINGESLEPVSVNTDSKFEEVVLGNCKLVKGYTKLTISVVTGVISFSDVYLDVLTNKGGEVKVKTKGAFKSHIIPCVIQAEDFDFGSTYSSSKNSFKQNYRNDSKLRITEESSGCFVNMNSGDSAEYTFDVKKTGVYDLIMSVGATGIVRVYFDSYPGYVEATPDTSTQNSLGSVYLTQGIHKLKIECVSDNFTIDNVRFKVSAKDKNYYTPSDLTNGKIILIEEDEEIKKENPVWKNIYVSTEGSDRGNGSEKSPFATVSRAKEEAARISSSMKGDIVINIEPGNYFLDKTIEFTTKDSGKNGYNIIYRAADSKNKPQLSGGREITGWQKVEGNDNIWYAKVTDDISEVRQLYINGYPAEIARSKYIYNGYKAYDDPMTPDEEDGFYIKKKNFPELSNAEDAEVLFTYMWQMHIFPLSKISECGEDWLIEYDQPYFGRYYRRALADCTPAAGIAFRIQNAPELIDEPGEFYFDRKNKKVYYYAFPEEDMTTAVTCTPYTHKLITINGEGKNNKVSNIVFNSLDFRLGAWNEVSEKGVSPIQGDCIAPSDLDNLKTENRSAAVKMPAQFEMNFADNISVTNCDFVQLGSTALAMRHCVTNSEISGNFFGDISGTAIVVGDFDYTSAVNTVEDVSRNIKVNNNVIRRIGHDYYNAVGILIFYANSVDVMHNDIKHTPYTGISVGWGWGDPLSNVIRSGEHNIANNRIDYTSMTLHDGASIYTLGEMKGMYIQGNHMSNSKDSGGIYFDQGSASIVARDNVFDNNKINTFFAGALITDIYRNYANYVDAADMTVWNSAGKDMSGIERPYRTEGDNWGPEARAIIKNSGLEDNYKHLLESNKLYYPSWRDMSIATFDSKRFVSDTEFVVWGTNWMDGGEGVAFHEVNDVEPEDYGAKNSILGNTCEGEWLKYKAHVTNPGNYKLDMYYALAFMGDEANASTETGVTISLDGVKLCDDLGLESTGSWDARLAKPITEVNLTEGEHEIKVEFTRGAFAFERLQFISTSQKGSDNNYDDGIIFKLSK